MHSSPTERTSATRSSRDSVDARYARAGTPLAAPQPNAAPPPAAPPPAATPDPAPAAPADAVAVAVVARAGTDHFGSVFRDITAMPDGDTRVSNGTSSFVPSWNIYHAAALARGMGWVAGMGKNVWLVGRRPKKKKACASALMMVREHVTLPPYPPSERVTGSDVTG